MAMVIHKLLDAIKAKFDATAALVSAFPGGFFADEAAARTAMDFLLCEVGPVAPITDAYGNAISADVTIIFKAIGKGDGSTPALELVAAKMATVVSTFDHTTLTLTGATNIGMWRVSEPVPTRLVPDQAGLDVYQWAVPYQYQIQ